MTKLCTLPLAWLFQGGESLGTKFRPRESHIRRIPPLLANRILEQISRLQEVPLQAITESKLAVPRTQPESTEHLAQETFSQALAPLGQAWIPQEKSTSDYVKRFLATLEALELEGIREAANNLNIYGVVNPTETPGVSKDWTSDVTNVDSASFGTEEPNLSLSSTPPPKSAQEKETTESLTADKEGVYENGQRVRLDDGPIHSIRFQRAREIDGRTATLSSWAEAFAEPDDRCLSDMFHDAVYKGACVTLQTRNSSNCGEWSTLVNASSIRLCQNNEARLIYPGGDQTFSLLQVKADFDPLQESVGLADSIDSEDEQWPDSLDDDDPDAENDDVEPLRTISQEQYFDNELHKALDYASHFSIQRPGSRKADLFAHAAKSLSQYYMEESCLRNYTSPCPQHWTWNKDSDVCTAPEGYQGLCGPVLSKLAKDNLGKLESVCQYQWPCLNSAPRNLDACPSRWMLVYADENTTICVAPDGNRDCNPWLDVKKLATVEKVLWSNRCQEEWPVDESKFMLNSKYVHGGVIPRGSHLGIVSIIRPTDAIVTPGASVNLSGPIDFTSGKLGKYSIIEMVQADRASMMFATLTLVCGALLTLFAGIGCWNLHKKKQKELKRLSEEFRFQRTATRPHETPPESVQAHGAYVASMYSPRHQAQTYRQTFPLQVPYEMHLGNEMPTGYPPPLCTMASCQHHSAMPPTTGYINPYCWNVPRQQYNPYHSQLVQTTTYPGGGNPLLMRTAPINMQQAEVRDTSVSSQPNTARRQAGTGENWGAFSHPREPGENKSGGGADPENGASFRDAMILAGMQPPPLHSEHVAVPMGRIASPRMGFWGSKEQPTHANSDLTAPTQC